MVHVNSIIGDNCKIGQNATIGGKGGVPKLLDNVYVGGQFCVWPHYRR